MAKKFISQGAVVAKFNPNDELADREDIFIVLKDDDVIDEVVICYEMKDAETRYYKKDAIKRHLEDGSWFIMSPKKYSLL